jgi:hypothetical protein
MSDARNSRRSEIPEVPRVGASRRQTARSRVGISDHAQGLLGDLVYVELPERRRHGAGRQRRAVVESVKAASDVYAPVSGEIVEVNESLSRQARDDQRRRVRRRLDLRGQADDRRRARRTARRRCLRRVDRERRPLIRVGRRLFSRRPSRVIGSLFATTNEKTSLFKLFAEPFHCVSVFYFVSPFHSGRNG